MEKGTEIIKFDDTEIEKYKFHQYKSHILISDKDIKKIVVSNTSFFGKQDFKNFIGYKDSENIRLACIFRPHMIIYKIYFRENRRICFPIKAEKVFIKPMEISKVSNIIKS